MNVSHPNARRIRRVTESIISLPTLPTVVSKMIDLVDNPKTSAASLARLISSDQALTARVLKLANSSFYGFSREISTVNMAIVVLGFNTVKDMGLSLSVFDILKKSPGSAFFDISQFWDHSIACGVASKLIVQKYFGRNIAEAFVVGLLHDIGKAILSQYARNDFDNIMELVNTDGVDLDEAERIVIGTGHGQVGAWLCDKWNLPPLIGDCIRHHHAPGEAETDPPLVASVHLADTLCHRTGIGNSGRPRPPSLDGGVWGIFAAHGVDCTEASLEALQEEFILEYERSETLLSYLHEN